MDACIAHLPASENKLQEYKSAQQSDPLCSLVIEFCQTGWPSKHQIDTALVPYWEARGDLTLQNDLLLYGNRIVVPTLMQQVTLTKLLQEHQGIERC